MIDAEALAERVKAKMKKRDRKRLNAVGCKCLQKTQFSSLSKSVFKVRSRNLPSVLATDACFITD